MELCDNPKLRFIYTISTRVLRADGPVYEDQYGATLVPVTQVVPIETILASYGVSSSPDDTALPGFLEAALELAGGASLDEEDIEVADATVSTFADEQDNLVSETLEVSGWRGSLTMTFDLTSSADGSLSLYVATFDGDQPMAEHKYWLQLYGGGSELNINVIALPGKCKCSQSGGSACNDTQCEDGVSCGNGKSCGFYTRSL